MSAYPVHDLLLLHFMSYRTGSNKILSKLQELLDAGSGVNQLDNTRRTPLECCVQLATLDSTEIPANQLVIRGKVIELLLKKGADPDLQDNRGWNLLHLAAWNGDLFFIQQCVRLGRGSLHAMNHDNQQPVYLAALKGHQHVTHYIDSRSGDLRSMSRAVIRTTLGKRCHKLDKLVLPPRLKLFLNYNIPYTGFSAVLVPPEPWTPAQLHAREVEGAEIRQFIADHASEEFLLTHQQELGEGPGEEGEGSGLVELFQEMYLWEAFKNVDYEEPLPRAPRYSLNPIDKNKKNRTRTPL